MSRKLVIWTSLVAACVIPVAIAATSPQLQWRGPVYIAAGFAGIIAMALLLIQPLLAGGYLPGFTPRGTRQIHGWVGTGLVSLVVIHVAALWWTSPPDVIDALLFRSPTPFSVWGVLAMWAVFAAAILAALRRKLRIKPALWRLIHLTFATVIVSGSVVHAMLIEGTMGTLSKAALCALAMAATLQVIVTLKPWKALARRQS